MDPTPTPAWWRSPEDIAASSPAWNRRQMTTPAVSPTSPGPTPQGATDGTTMPAGLDRRSCSPTGPGDLVIVLSRAADRSGDPAGRSFWRWRDWGVGEGSGTGRPTIFDGSVWMGGAGIGHDSALASGREDGKWQRLNPAACRSARCR